MIKRIDYKGNIILLQVDLSKLALIFPETKHTLTARVTGSSGNSTYIYYSDSVSSEELLPKIDELEAEGKRFIDLLIDPANHILEHNLRAQGFS